MDSIVVVEFFKSSYIRPDHQIFANDNIIPPNRLFEIYKVVLDKIKNGYVAEIKHPYLDMLLKMESIIEETSLRDYVIRFESGNIV
jgi:hypothetical protein